MDKRKARQADLAHRVAYWLEMNGCTVTIVYKDYGYDINYTLKADVKPQPAIRIERTKVVFPNGSQEEVVFNFISSSLI